MVLAHELGEDGCNFRFALKALRASRYSVNDLVDGILYVQLISWTVYADEFTRRYKSDGPRWPIPP